MSKRAVINVFARATKSYFSPIDRASNGLADEGAKVMSNEMNRFVSGNKKTTRKSTGPPGGMMMWKFHQRDSCWWLGAVSGTTGPGAVGSMSLQEGPVDKKPLKVCSHYSID